MDNDTKCCFHKNLLTLTFSKQLTHHLSWLQTVARDEVLISRLK